MLLRQFVGGDPPHTCTLVFIDDPTGFGHRVVDGGRLVEHVLTREAEFERAVAEKGSEGFVETGSGRSPAACSRPASGTGSSGWTATPWGRRPAGYARVMCCDCSVQEAVAPA